MNPEVLTAKNWYRWLWVSPFFTVYTVIIIKNIDPGRKLVCGGNWQNCDHIEAALVTFLFAFTLSALWHLILLIPSLNKKSRFVQWHGLQALLLAGIQSIIPLIFLVIACISWNEDIIAISIPLIIIVWLVGTILGQKQAASGDCSLMRWIGHSEGLPLTVRISPQTSELHQNQEINTEIIPLEAYYNNLRLYEPEKLDEAVLILYTQLVSNDIPDLKNKVAEELNRTRWTVESLPGDFLVAIYRFSHNPEQRRTALNGLERLGLVESL